MLEEEKERDGINMIMDDYIHDNALLNHSLKNVYKKITQETRRVGRKVLLTIDGAMPDLTTFRRKGNRKVLYFVQGFEKFLPNGNRVYRIRRVDGHIITSFDMANLPKGKQITMVGTLNNYYGKERF